MSELSIMTAQPFEVSIDGKICKFLNLVVDDWGYLEQWSESDLQARGKPISSDEIARHCFSFAAIPQKIFLMLRRNHPEITVAEAGGLLSLPSYRLIEEHFSGVFVNTDVELLNAAKAVADAKAKGQGENEARAALDAIIERAANEVQGKARPTESG